MNSMKLGKKKVKDINYQRLEVQQYLTDPDFSTEKRNILYALRSRMHSAKSNFKKMNAGNLLCSQGCQIEEDQVHIFENCQSLNVKKETIVLDFIFQETEKQKVIMKQILPIELRRLSLLEDRARAEQCFIA